MDLSIVLKGKYNMDKKMLNFRIYGTFKLFKNLSVVPAVGELLTGFNKKDSWKTIELSGGL